MAVEFRAFSQALLSDNGDGTYEVIVIVNSSDSVNGEEFTEIAPNDDNVYNVGEMLDQNNFNGPGADVTVLGTINGGLVTRSGSSAPTIYFSELNTTAVSVGDTVTINPVAFTPCFLRGTRVLTDEGLRAVQDLAAGDRVLTRDQQFKPIRWIGHRSLEPGDVLGGARARQLPVRIAAGALGADRPLRDLYLSPEHCLWHNGALVPARALVNGRNITQPERDARIDYFHIMLDAHDVIYVEGTPSETFQSRDNSYLGFANFFEFMREHRETDADPCAPILMSGAALDAWRADIAARAAGDIASAPQVRIYADGQEIRPSAVADGHYTFDLPAPARIEVASCVTSPAWFGGKDARRIGVALIGATLNDTALQTNDWALGADWHQGAHHWTAQARAALPLSTCAPARLTLHLVHAACGYPAQAVVPAPEPAR